MSSPNEWNERNQTVIEEFRANNGQVSGPNGDRSIVLLHTTGAKSGLARINPLVYTADDQRYVIIASKGGADTHPDWYHNLVAQPEVRVEAGAEQFQALATIAEEPERSRLYERMATKFPFFAKYQQQAKRTIPLIILTRLT